MSDATVTITASSQWWKYAVKMLSLSAERSGSGDSTSFLACFYIDARSDSLELHAESDVSTTFVSGEDDAHVEGEGDYLVRSTDFSSYINQMPSGGDVTVSFDDEKYSVEFEDGSVSFSNHYEKIVSDDAVPRAQKEVPGKSATATCSGNELVSAYLMGSSMAKTKDKDSSAGYDPLSGALVSIEKDSLSIMSAASSSAEVSLEVKTQGTGKKAATSLTFPDSTKPRIAAFSDGEVEVSIDKDDFLYLSDGFTIIRTNPINIGKMRTSLSYDRIFRVSEQLHQARTMSFSLQVKDLIDAVKRAMSVGSEVVKIEVSSSSVKLSSRKAYGSTPPPFSQKISAKTTWFDDGEQWIDLSVSSRNLERISRLATQSGSLIFEVAIHPQKNSPWGLIIYDPDSDFDYDNPHNFFIINAVSV